MRIVVEVDGVRTVLDVGADAVRADPPAGPIPFTVTRVTDDRIELEVAGEPVVIEGWGRGRSAPPAELVVAGERWRFRTEPLDHAPSVPSPARAPSPSEAPVLPTAGDEVAIPPPMPGRVVEVRVAAGDAVAAGQVLLVLEAMKMRNEVTAPVAGTVVAVNVRAGSNVRTGEPMVRLRPGGAGDRPPLK